MLNYKHDNQNYCTKFDMINTVTVTTSARLHMGFFDLKGSVSRTFGSLGLCIDAPCTQIVVTKSDKTGIEANYDENIIKIVENIIKIVEVEQKFLLTIRQSIPQHAGLGSGTQLALAIGVGLSALFNLNLTVPQISILSKRGNRSGIGVAAFEHGGVLVDSGKTNNELPKIALRQAFPDNWRVLLIADSAYIGVHGEVELQAFQSLKPAHHSLRTMIFEHMMPALQRADLFAFGAYMANLQVYNGDYFAPIQGGRYASNDVANVLLWLQQNGVVCVGQSSWGPTGFAILESEERANIMLKQLQHQFLSLNNLSFQVVRGKNSGAVLTQG